MRRKTNLLLGVLTLTILMTSCGAQSNADNINSNSVDYEVLNMPVVETTEGDFVYRLVTEKEEYQEGDSVKISAELSNHLPCCIPF